MLRRLEKRILVSLPSTPARQAMISHWLPPRSSTGGVELRTELDYETLAKVCYSYNNLLSVQSFSCFTFSFPSYFYEFILIFIIVMFGLK